MPCCFQSINLIWKSFFVYIFLGRSKYLYRSSWAERLILANFKTIKSPLVIEFEVETTIFWKPVFYSNLCKSLFRCPEKVPCWETSTWSTFWTIHREWNKHGTCAVTFIKNLNRWMETFFAISNAFTLFSHKVIFPADNIKKFGIIFSKMKI